MKKTPILALCWLVLFSSLAQASEKHKETVKGGDTLSALSQKFLGKASLYPKIQKKNGLKDPHRIYIGQVLIIPDLKAKDSAVPAVAPEVKSIEAAPVAPIAKEAEVKVTEKDSKINASDSNMPVAGKKAKDAGVQPVKKNSKASSSNSNKPVVGKKAKVAEVSAEVKATFENALALFQNPQDIKESLRLHGGRFIERVMDYIFPGRNKYRGTSDLAISLLAYPAHVQKALAEKIAKKDCVTVHIPRGQISLMTFGKDSVAINRGAWIGEESKQLAADEYSVEIDGFIWKAWNLFDCRNWARPPETAVVIPPVAPPPSAPPKVTKSSEESTTVVRESTKECHPEMDFTTGAYLSKHDPAREEDRRSTGKGAYLEGMFWKNCKSDCSSEYSWGVGGIGSIYDYSADHLPTGGDGWRVAGEVGLKRNWEKNALNQSWEVKVRLGWEESNWENTETGKSISQNGLVYGLYAENIKELQRNKLWWVTQFEAWSGSAQNINGPAEWNLEPESRTQFQLLTGLDYRLPNHPNWTLRGQIGGGYQWSVEDGFVPWNLQAMYELPHKNGRIAFGPYGQFWFQSGIDLGIFVRYESGDLVRKYYSDLRAQDNEYTGKKGIAFGKTLEDLEKEKPVSHKTAALAESFPQGE